MSVGTAWLVLHGVWCIVPSLCTLAMLLRRRAALITSVGRKAALGYGIASLCDHAGLACEAVALLALLQWVLGPGAAWAGGLLLGGYVAFVGLDISLFAVAGMRVAWQLVRLAGGLTGFANDLPWRSLLVACGAATLAAGFTGFKATQYATVALGQPWVALDGVLAVLLLGLGHGIHHRLGAKLAIAWNNRIVAMQLGWVRVARPVSRTQHAPGDIVAQAVAAWAIPDLHKPCAGDYPLWRPASHPPGPKRTAVRMEAGEKPHVVMLFLESFRALEVGCLGGRPGITPHFDRLSGEGVLWRNFYTAGNLTSRAMVASLYGVLPPFAEISTQAMQPPPPLHGMPHMFRARGYRSVLFSDGPLDWENKMPFYLGQGFEHVFGQTSIKAAYPEAPMRGAWDFQDAYMMRFHVDWLAKHHAMHTPTFTAMLTISNHMPFPVYENYPTPPASFNDVDPAHEYYNYLRTMMYTDACVGLYVDLLRERGLDKDVILFVLADHGVQFDPHTHNIDYAGMYRDALLRVPCMLLAPGRVAPDVIDEVASQADLLPTVMDMFDMPEHHHSIGTSLLRQSHTRRAISHHPWSPAFCSIRTGALRQTYLFETQQSELHDVQADPQQKRDLCASMPERAAQGVADATAIRAGNERLHAQKQFAPADAGAGLPTFVDPEQPQDLDGYQKRHDLLRERVRTKNASRPERVEWLLLQHVLGLGFPAETRLAHAGIVYHHGHREMLGELRDADKATLDKLIAVVFPED